jgi:hypothetical protein
MTKNFKENFNFYSNILLLTVLFFGGFIWADSNGVWTFAKDIRGGTFGSDEQADTNNFTFINPVYFGKKMLSLENPSNYFINFTGRSQLYEIATDKLTTSELNSNNIVTNNLKVLTIFNCNGKLYTDSTGKVICGLDNVNDGDYNSTNELQDLNSVLNRGNNANYKRITNLATPIGSLDVANKYYVDLKVNSIKPPTCYGTGKSLQWNGYGWVCKTEYCSDYLQPDIEIYLGKVTFNSRDGAGASAEGWIKRTGCNPWQGRVKVYQSSGGFSCDSGWKSIGSVYCVANQAEGWILAPFGSHKVPALKGRGHHYSTYWCSQKVYDEPKSDNYNNINC